MDNISEIPGIGKPIKSLPVMWSAITLYLANLNTPQITINKLITVTSIFSVIVCWLISVYMNIAGATPKETTSDNESMFFPNPNHHVYLFYELPSHLLSQTRLLAS